MTQTASALLGTVNKNVIADLGIAQFLAANSWLFLTSTGGGGSNIDSANGITPDFTGVTQIAPVVGTARVIGKNNAQTGIQSISDDGSGFKYAAATVTATVGAPCANQYGFIATKDGASSTNCYVSTNFGSSWTTLTGASFTALAVDAICDNVSANANALFIQDAANPTTVIQAGTPVAVNLPNAGTANRAKLINGYFVVATNRGIAYLTPGQKTYTEVLPTGGASPFQSIEYSAELGLYIAVGDAGKIYTAAAAAGIAPPAGPWTSRTGITTDVNYEVVWCPTQKKPDGTVTFTGKFIVGGTGTASLSALQYSTDGVTWTACTGPSFVSASTTFERRSLAFRPLISASGGIAVGVTNAGTGLCRRTTDGITWVAATTGSAGTGPTGPNQNVIASPRGFFFKAASNLYFSTDGDVWATTTTLGWATVATGGDTVIYGTVSGEICRVKGGNGRIASNAAGSDGGSSNNTGGKGAVTPSNGGAGQDGNGGPSATPPANSPTNQSLGGTGATSASQSSAGGTALQAWRFPAGFPGKIPGAGGGAGSSTAGGGGGSSAFGRGADGNGSAASLQPASGPGGGGSGSSAAAFTGGAGGAESAVRLLLSVVPGETITAIYGQSVAGKSFVAYTVGNDGFASLEYAA